MFIVITGLDGSGTSTIAKELSKKKKNSILLKTPSSEYSDRDSIDKNIRPYSRTAHFLYYLSSTVYMSDYIKENLDYENNDIYCVRYLIDTVVSNRVGGVDVDLDYNIYGNELLHPDVTIFVSLNEKIRQTRISNRGKSTLDKVLDDDETRSKFLEQFSDLLPADTIFVDNSLPLEENVEAIYSEINKRKEEKKQEKFKVKVLRPHQKS